ncbi:unnamed protein product [Haemonchus placei]|uniref:Nicotinate phosphoribosyltransferase n=1 Tax=Haemonchus placei TaxID=6290 RepID=A0A158QKN2_HAEPC|nr:unnamed protein product [Haemonchus placei]
MLAIRRMDRIGFDEAAGCQGSAEDYGFPDSLEKLRVRNLQHYTFSKSEEIERYRMGRLYVKQMPVTLILGKDITFEPDHDKGCDIRC